MTTANGALTAWSLGLAGLIPFVAPAALALAGNPFWLNAQHTYAACILAFLGALHWGPALNGSAQHPALLLIWGVIPSLIAWIALQYYYSVPGLVAGLILAFAADLVLARYHQWPSYYLSLRAVLTVVASLSLLVGWRV
jgi:hypothetical protein